MRRRGPWSPREVASFLDRTVVPLRLACNGSSGSPILASLWFVADGETLCCATQRSARIVERLRDDPRCAFEVAQDTPPYRGVRGQGRVAIDEGAGPALLERLIARYVDPASAFADWLRARAHDETALRIEPVRLLSWDFAERMG